MPDWVPYSILAYLLGSIPFGKWIARRVARIDISKRGSGNIGATNVAREVGLRWGLLTLALDALKGALPVALLLLAPLPGPDPSGPGAPSLVGLSALLGHQFSLFEGFRGGKGVATGLGVYLVLAPFSCGIALALFVLVVYRWKYVSLGSLAAASSLPILLLGKPSPVAALAAVAAGLIFLKHRENLRRLLRGDEPKWPQPGISREDPEAGPAPPGNSSE
jgi:glycerol-3-phosphate acyltransferase PlsY